MKIKDYSNYQATMCGNIIGARGKTLKFDINSVGYRRVTLCKEGITNRQFVHRLIAETFIDNPNEYKCVNHINGDRTDNRVNNLEWCTHSYNSIDGYKRGRVLHNTGKRAKKYFGE